MSNIDEIFDTMSSSSGELNDACFIDSQTRVITVPSMFEELGVVSDEKVTRVVFVCPKIVGDNVDLTNYNLYVNYQNAAGELNAYLIDDVSVLEVTQGNMIAFSWLLSRHVTAAPGTVRYIICAKKSDGTSTTNEWNTKVATGIVVANDIEPVKEIEDQNIDVIEQILARIDVLENRDASNVSLEMTSAVAGQFAKVKTIDSDGAPTSWEAESINVPTKISAFENDADYAKKSEVPQKVRLTNSPTNTDGYVTESDLFKFVDKNGLLTEDYLPWTNFSKENRNGHKVGNVVTVAEIDTSDGSVMDFSSEELNIPTEDIDANTAARHTHNNKEVLDQIKGIVGLNSDITQGNQENIIRAGTVVRLVENEADNLYDRIEPMIPTKTSQLENDSNYLTEHQSLTEYAKKTEIPTVPTKTSQLENDSNYLTEHQSLAEYAKKTEIPNKAINPYVDSDDPGYTTPKTVGEMISKYAFTEQQEIPYNIFEKDSDYGNIGDTIVIAEQETDGHPTKFAPKSLSNYIEQSQLDDAIENLSNNISQIFAMKSDIPASLKNPNALTIKIGDSTTTYDGSEAKMVDVDVGTSESIPSYWLTHLQTKADKIREVMEGAGRNKSAFLFYTDAHWDYGAKKAPMLLKYLYNNTPINKTIFGGDIVNSESTDRDVMEYLWKWRKQVRELPNHHSVVGNHDDGNSTNNLFSTDYVYSFLLAAEETPNIMQGGDMYYYIDEPCEKTRYLYLDTAYIGINDAQLAFIKEALKTTPDNWHIVAVSHIWYEPDYDQYNVKPIPIAGYGTGVENVVNMFDNYNARQNEFSSCTARVEFCIGGHCHRDYTGCTTGGIPIILCETDSYHNRSGLTNTAGTTAESSVNAIITNYTTEKVNVIRIGRGENFEVPLHASVTPPSSYTNLIPTAIDTSGNVYNNSGYKAGTYINSSDGVTEVANAGYWCTGLIPITKGDVVRIKYVFNKSTYSDSDLYYYSHLCFYNADRSFNRFKYLNEFLNNNFISGTYEWTGTNFEGTLTFTFDGASSMFNNAKYIRVSSAYLGNSANVQTSIANAVITINEEID